MSATPEFERRRIEPHNVTEGDRVFLGINLHGTSDDYENVEYDSDIYQAGVVGEVVKAPRESARELLAEGHRVMADITVEIDGSRYTWNIDNGYVLGYHPGMGRRSDIGHFGGIYEPSE